MRIKRWRLDGINRCRRKATSTVIVLVLLGVSVSVGSVQARGLLFTQQDAMQTFDLGTGKGYQIGIATGKISGTTFVDFQFAPTGPPVGNIFPISFQSKVIITDIDGDQIFFDNNATGSFHSGVLPDDFMGTGGPLTGTYVVTGGTGKYQSWTVGTTYKYRAIMSNPPTPPGALGSVYVEISRYRMNR